MSGDPSKEIGTLRDSTNEDQDNEMPDRKNIHPELLKENEPVTVPEASQTWECRACTFINAAGRPGCELCGSEPSEDQSVAESDENNEWNIYQKAHQKECEEKFLEQEKLRVEKNFQEYKRIDDEKVVIPDKPFECPACFLETQPENGIRLRGCLHDVCKDCLTNMVTYEESGAVKCCECDKNIEDRDIMNSVEPKLWEKRLKRARRLGVATLKNKTQCLTPNCEGVAEIVDEVNSFHCPICQQDNCLPCKAIHGGQTCQEYQDDLRLKADTDEAAKRTLELLQNMIKDGDAMECPSCRIFLQKKEGCDWMMCSMCKTEICWVTKNFRWGPKGQGDISGGCGCRVGGKKCHPDCNYCH